VTNIYQPQTSGRVSLERLAGKGLKIAQQWASYIVAIRLPRSLCLLPFITLPGALKTWWQEYALQKILPQ